MDKKLYGFNPSQDVIRLQTKYTLFKRVENILFSTVVKGGFDKSLMTQAINLLFERHDCLRIRFVDKGKTTYQYFEDKRVIGVIPEKKFRTYSEQTSFLHRFRSRKANCYKGDVLRVIFAEDPVGEQLIYFKVSHYVADTYGIGVLVSDLFSVYESLSKGTPLPPAPGSFEKLLEKDAEYRSNDQARVKDEEFFRDYFQKKHPEDPMYCGVHGSRSDRWMKVKKKGGFAMPYFLVRCDTEGYRFIMPRTIGQQAREWCGRENISLATFFFYTFAIATSLINDRARYQTPLMLLDCRGTVSERKAAGTKVQPLSVYTTVDYSRSFSENITDEYQEQQELYKHTRLTYLEVEQIQHKLWGHSMLSQTYGFCFSFIPTNTPENVTLQVLSNGKCSLTAYVALMFDVKTGSISTVYDVQTILTKPEILAEFNNTYIRVIESVLEKSDIPMSELFVNF